MEKSSNKLIKLSEDGTDRISNLPDSLISKILSLLSTENAVATSILSRRWKLLWTSVTTLNFVEDRPNNRVKMKKTKFTVFVNRLIISITPPFIHKFRLNCSHTFFDPIHLEMWISVIAQTVRELDLDIFQFNLMKGNVFEMQMNHFRFNKLVILKLKGNIKFIIPPQSAVCFPNLQQLCLTDITFPIPDDSSVSFPNLKILKFYCFVGCPSGKYVQKLISICPALLDLSIDITPRKGLPRFLIRVTSLTKLKLTRSYSHQAFKIKIDDPHKLQFLSVSSYAFKVIKNGFSDFYNLKRLEVDVGDCLKLSLVIDNLLECMDNLEHLAITMNHRSCSCTNTSWSQPSNLPKGLEWHVTTISFDQISDDCHFQLEFLRYILKNARVLQVLRVSMQSYYSSEKRNELVKKVSNFPKESQTCQVKFLVADL